MLFPIRGCMSNAAMIRPIFIFFMFIMFKSKNMSSFSTDHVPEFMEVFKYFYIQAISNCLQLWIMWDSSYYSYQYLFFSFCWIFPVSKTLELEGMNISLGFDKRHLTAFQTGCMQHNKTLPNPKAPNIRCFHFTLFFLRGGSWLGTDRVSVQ